MGKDSLNKTYGQPQYSPTNRMIFPLHQIWRKKNGPQ